MRLIFPHAKWGLMLLVILSVSGLALLSSHYGAHATGTLTHVRQTPHAAMPGDTTTANWAMFGYDAAHTGYNPLETTLSPSNVSGLTLDWSVPYGQTLTGPNSGINYAPTLTEANGILYAPTSSALFALDASTGATLWNFSLSGSWPGYAVISGSTIYVNSLNTIYALDAATGVQLWSHTFQGTIPPSPTVGGGMLFVSISNRKVRALDATTGADLWSFSTGGAVGYSSPAYDNGVVYVGAKNFPNSPAPSVYAIDATTGKKLWSYATIGRIESSPVVRNGIVYIGSINKTLYALDAVTGALRWSYATWSAIYSSPAVDNSTVYVAPGGKLYALDAATGKLLWRKTYAGRWRTSSPSVANGVVYLGVGNLDVFDAATGNPLYTCLQCGYNSIIVNGLVYVTTGSGQIAAYHLAS